jgi:UDP-glucose 4-epimerase
MRVVVTGATGNVGTALLRRLDADEQVTSIVGIARRLPDDDHGLKKVVWSEADVAVDDMRPHFDGADALVHLAWLFQPTHRPSVTWTANAVGSARVFGAAAEVGTPAVVYASSVGAYSPAPDRTVDESWPTHSMPTAAYGREKAYAERVLDAFEARHPDVRVVRMRPAFIFQRPSATEQRRLFLGPLLPNWVVEPGRLPALPLPPNLRFQALHADDAAEAYRLAVMTEVRGAFNLAAEGVVDGEVLAELLGTKLVELPRVVVRAGLALAWQAHLVPADPALLDLVLELPLLDPTRARTELGWEPQLSATEALQEMLAGWASGAGAPTEPLAPDSALRRAAELADGVGERA